MIKKLTVQCFKEVIKIVVIKNQLIESDNLPYLVSKWAI